MPNTSGLSYYGGFKKYCALNYEETTWGIGQTELSTTPPSTTSPAAVLFSTPLYTKLKAVSVLSLQFLSSLSLEYFPTEFSFQGTTGVQFTHWSLKPTVDFQPLPHVTYAAFETLVTCASNKSFSSTLETQQSPVSLISHTVFLFE